MLANTTLSHNISDGTQLLCHSHKKNALERAVRQGAPAAGGGPEPVLAARLQARAAVMPVQREQLEGDARQQLGDGFRVGVRVMEG